MPELVQNTVQNGVHLRPATGEDAAEAAPLIYGASPALSTRIYGPAAADAQAFFEAVFPLPETPYSCDSGIVAVRDGVVVGLALAAPAREVQRGWPVLGRQMIRRRGISVLWKMLPVMWDLHGSTTTPPPDAYYLSILSVRADCRGQGIGGLLLSEVCRRADAEKFPATFLHAEIDNAGARRLYAGHGFETAAEHPTPRAARWGVTGFATLRRPRRVY